MGPVVLDRHFTLSQTEAGPDHHALAQVKCDEAVRFQDGGVVGQGSKASSVISIEPYSYGLLDQSPTSSAGFTGRT
ncbi:hypothetical protein GCM10027598_35580 [Amycolatopsis oliviviridis]|uniref:Uncharacterized protein n=1 Tax=Amycolatopsis oliviviridis TaxID=1471590 RepID=A0ABQ3LEH5_9PSEU|nr:hypothetical protein [Amycolatopsis oliviviridis]GHH13464.1 hypothetical protein GCM10017790_26250 [Amycolatopsis oliviviridis]